MKNSYQYMKLALFTLVLGVFSVLMLEAAGRKVGIIEVPAGGLIIDGTALASTLTATELNILDGIAATLTSTELNTLDGIAATLTATELRCIFNKLKPLDGTKAPALPAVASQTVLTVASGTAAVTVAA